MVGELEHLQCNSLGLILGYFVDIANSFLFSHLHPVPSSLHTDSVQGHSQSLSIWTRHCNEKANQLVAVDENTFLRKTDFL